MNLIFDIPFLILMLVGFLAQYIDGALGMGYGVTSATILISLGIYPPIASASIHAAKIFVGLISGASHFKLGNVGKELSLPLIIFGVPGGIIGAYGLVSLPANPVRLAVGCALLAMGCIILYRFIFQHKSGHESTKRYSPKSLATLGFFAALIDAIGGGGWGPICTPSLMITGSDSRKAIGSVNLAESFVTTAMTLTFIILLGPENFRWDIALALSIAGLIIAPISAFTCKKLPNRLLGTLVGLTVVILSTRTLLTTFGL